MVERWRYRRRGVLVGSFTAGLFAVLLPSDRAHAGVVSFEPAFALIEPGELIEFELSLTSLESLPGLQFDAIDVVVGSDDGVTLVDFEFSPEALEACFGFFCGVTNPGPRVYESDLKFGFFAPNPAALPLVLPFPLGTLTVDTTGLPSGEYHVVIDGAFDQQSIAAYGLPTEPLFGYGVMGISEPATLALLGVATLAVVCRRRSR